MAEPVLSPAEVVLLAVQVTIDVDIAALRALIAQHRKTLHTDIILRILLTYLPESLDSSEYVPFLLDLSSGHITTDPTTKFNISPIEDLDSEDAIKRVRKLRLLPLASPSAPPGAPDDPFIHFLIHRAYRVDEETGFLTQLPKLLMPFLDRSPYLRTWMISSVLPLLRLNYEYYPHDDMLQTIAAFERLDDWASVNLLLSRTGKEAEHDGDGQGAVGRNLRGLVGPWMYGDSLRKRRKLRDHSDWNVRTVAPLDEAVVVKDSQNGGWEQAFRWIISQAAISWTTSVDAIEQWDGPGDVDFGDYGDGKAWLEEHEQQFVERRYARAALATAYRISETSVEALTGVQRILSRLIALMDFDRIPTLPAAAALLSPISAVDGNGIVVAENATYLCNGLMDERNVLTAPNLTSISLLHGLLISALLLTRAGVPCSIRTAGELVLLQDEAEQRSVAQSFMRIFENGPKGDDKYWIRVRNELLWLRSWGAEDVGEDLETSQGRGVFGKVNKDFLEMEFLKALLANTRYTLARSIYESSPERPLSVQQIRSTVIAAAMNAYDNATNPNRTRGGMKKCDDIIHAFPDTITGSLAANRIEFLLAVTHSIGRYRLVLKQGEPFTPVALRVHGDPISIIGKILDQNPKSYTKINDLVHMTEQMVFAGLTLRDVEGHAVITKEQEQEQLAIAKRRVTSMCIDAALSEDDFETAYSYVMNRLSSVAAQAQARTPELERTKSGIFAHTPPRILDDWSWRAALQAGKYRPNRNTIRPTHLGNTSGNLDIRHLEQRKDCLSQALRIAPPSTLHEILNVFRRCEEELDAKMKEEAEQEDAWDEQGDQTTMPGGFAVDRPTNSSRANTAKSRVVEEAPMSLFDLTRASAAKAQSSLSALTNLTGGVAGDGKAKYRTGTGEGPEDGAARATVRKRDQLRNAAVGTLATGIGWLINAPAPAPASESL